MDMEREEGLVGDEIMEADLDEENPDKKDKPDEEEEEEEDKEDLEDFYGSEYEE